MKKGIEFLKWTKNAKRKLTKIKVGKSKTTGSAALQQKWNSGDWEFIKFCAWIQTPRKSIFVRVCMFSRKHRIKYGRQECRRCRPAEKNNNNKLRRLLVILFVQNFQKECKMWLLRIHCKKSIEHKHISDYGCICL